MDPAVLVSYLQHQRLVMDYVNVATAAVLIYDYLLTFHLEVDLIWFSKWNYTSVLFTLTRYTPFVSMFLIVYSQTVPDISLEACKVIRPAAAWFVFLAVIFPAVVCSIRTWAIWNRNKVVGVALLVEFVASTIIQFIFVREFVNSYQYASPPYSGFRGCLLTHVDNILWKIYVTLLSCNLVLLVLVTIGAFRSYTSGYAGRLTHIIHVNGMLFYVSVLCLAAANLVTATLGPLDLSTMLSPLLACMYSIFMSRIVLNIREECSRGLHVELHIVYEESRPPATSHWFQAQSS